MDTKDSKGMRHPQAVIFGFIFLRALLSFILAFNHLIVTLIFLEFMTLSIYFLITIVSISIYNELFAALLYLAIAVCEGAIALALIVIYIRKIGVDLLKI